MNRSTYIAELFCLLSIAACGRQTIDPAFTDYVARFEDQAKAQGKAVSVNTSITFGATETEANGSGMNGECKNGAVVIDSVNWKERDDNEREELIFHELGHCVLNRVHRNDTVLNNVVGIAPASIMNWNLIPSGTYGAMRDQYYKELFQ